MPVINYRTLGNTFSKFRPQLSFNDPNNVASASSSYVEQSLIGEWELLCDLMAGTFAMRDKGEKWLPKQPKELDQSWRNRLNSSFLFPAFKDAVESVVSQPFSKPVTITAEDDVKLPDQLQKIDTDVDKTGQNLTQFARNVFETMVAFGRCGVLVDFPSTGGDLNLGEEQAGDVRPIFKMVHPVDLIGWRTETTPGGEERLTQIRIREWAKEPEGRYGDKDVQYIRVFNAPPSVATNVAGDGAVPGSPTLGTWELWKVEDNGTTTAAGEGTHTYPGIPFVMIYAKRTKFMEAQPPMRDLAELNLCHYGSSSDQRNYLRFCRIGMIAMTGVSHEEADESGTVGPNQTLKSVNPEAKFYYVEHTGKAIEAGERDIAHLEQQMEVLGMKPFVDRSSDSTATGKKIDNSKSNSDAISWAIAAADGLTECYKVAGKWVKQEIDEKFRVTLFTDFTVAIGDPTQGDFLLKCRTARELDQETFLTELKRRGFIGEDRDIEEIMANLESEGPSFEQQLEAERVKQSGDKIAGEISEEDGDDEDQGNRPPPPFAKKK